MTLGALCTASSLPSFALIARQFSIVSVPSSGLEAPVSREPLGMCLNTLRQHVQSQRCGHSLARGATATPASQPPAVPPKPFWLTRSGCHEFCRARGDAREARGSPAKFEPSVRHLRRRHAHQRELQGLGLRGQHILLGRRAVYDHRRCEEVGEGLGCCAPRGEREQGLRDAGRKGGIERGRVLQGEGERAVTRIMRRPRPQVPK